MRRRKTKNIQGYNHLREVTSPIAQPALRDEPLAPHQAEEVDASRYTIIVVSYRRRLLDEDNLCPKYHVDALRYCGVLPSDSARRTKIRVFQVQVKGADAEHTVIHIIPPHAES